ncbi:MFS transporter [Fangia hongkongensis]|uniref:MFS transporter n=1 Tax=Fangia hongkongensis TaxID=270495 RepID=UPI0003718257|nr:MFS transporter [Fangia hongkongensis]MBK2123948.1 MFS transporter [Fangia hongkongensis]
MEKTKTGESMQSNKSLVFYPMILMIAYWVITKAGLPFVDEMSQFFAVSHQRIQQILSLSLIISSLSPLLWGPLIDYISLKRFAIIASVLSFVITILMLITTSVTIFTITYIIATSIIFSLSVCSRSFPFIYFDQLEQKQKAIGITFMGVYFCSFMIPLFSGWIGFYLGWEFGYSLVLLWLFIVFIAMYRLKSNTEPVAIEKVGFLKNAMMIFMHMRTKGFLRYALFVAILNGLAWTYIIALPFWLASIFTIGSKYLALYLFPLALPGLLCPIIVSFLERFMSKEAIMKLSVIIFLIAGVLAIFLGVKLWDSAVIYIIPGVLLNLASAMAFAIASTKVFTHVKTAFNAASGLFSLIQYFAFGVIVFVESYISIHHYYLEGVLVCIGGVFLLILQRGRAN